MTSVQCKQLNRDAIAAIETGDLERAARLLVEAEAADPADPQTSMNRALVLRARGDLRGALAALEAALALDPYHFVALLSKGALLEQLGDPRAAAKVYRNALKIAPPDSSLPASIRAIAERARAAVARNEEALNSFLRTRTASLRARYPDADLSRFDECLDILSGTKKAYVQEPLFLTFPKLPPITFHDRLLFDWMPALEARTDVIRDELTEQLKVYWAKFHPYMQLPAGAPVNQWAALNHSPDWSSLHLWRDGKKVAENCALFPKTTAILDALPMADQPGYAPTAMFSILQPRTTIPPHTGSSNTRLIAHLPLIIPDGCRFRVGNDVRPWVMGESFVFDDTIEHEAWNDSDQLRAVLIFDVWNPLLSAAERAMVSAMTTAVNAYDAGG